MGKWDDRIKFYEYNVPFNYAKITGIKMIIGVPAPELLKYVNQKIIDFDIMVAIHNHGPNDEIYPT